MKKQEMKAEKYIETAVLLGFVVLIFLANRSVGFMRDDNWYATNLVTGEKLSGFADIVESQIWHFFNWGGRTVTHTILQAVIFGGELFADVLNTIMTILLGIIMARMAGLKEIKWISFCLLLLIAENYNVLVSMFWEAGCVNYVYSTVWILGYLWLYLRVLEGNTASLFGVTFWVLPLGLMTGWSNENMGPAALAVSTGITIYARFVQKEKIQLWQIFGILSSFVGSLLVILAPGNFVRSSLIVYDSIFDKIKSRLYEMTNASFSFLFLAFFVLLLVTVLYRLVWKFSFSKSQIALFIFMLLAHGAFFLSPTYPDRATFGVLCVCVLLSLSMLGRFWTTDRVSAATGTSLLQPRRINCYIWVPLLICVVRVLLIFAQIILFAEVTYPKDALAGIL